MHWPIDCPSFWRVNTPQRRNSEWAGVCTMVVGCPVLGPWVSYLDCGRRRYRDDRYPSHAWTELRPRARGVNWHERNKWCEIWNSQMSHRELTDGGCAAGTGILPRRNMVQSEANEWSVMVDDGWDACIDLSAQSTDPSLRIPPYGTKSISLSPRSLWSTPGAPVCTPHSFTSPGTLADWTAVLRCGRSRY